MDLETTGLGETDEIIEIGAIRKNGGEEQAYQQLINPSVGHISPRVFKLCHGITEAGLRGSPSFDDIRREFLDFIGDFTLVCHNAAFEKRMLKRALGREPKNILLDSLELFCLFKPHFPHHGLQYLLQHYLQENCPEEHRALADARNTMRLVQKLFSDLAGKDSDLLDKTLRITHGTNWGWLPHLQRISPPSLKQVTVAAPADYIGEPECRYTLEDIKHLLKNVEAWKKYFPGYTVRPQQLQMALSVADSFQGKQAIFIEAPTGSGKTLAYLLAALIFAVNKKRQVFISTNTKNLQQQVLDELPRVAAVLGMENIRFTDMKGISNYACRRKLEEETKLPGKGVDSRVACAYMANWARYSLSGELDEGTSYWFRMKNPVLNRLINAVRCQREDCAGRGCKYFEGCFYYRKVQAMKNSHICTVNHSLLLTWPYPEIKHLLIDEAHALEENAFEAFTREVSSSELAIFLERLAGKDKRGFLRYLHFHSRKYLPGLDIKPALGTMERIRLHGDSLSRVLGVSAAHYRLRMEVPKENKELREAALNLSTALVTLARFIDESIKEMSLKDEDFEDNTLFRQGGEYVKKSLAWAGLLEKCFEEEKDEQSCCYMEYSRSAWSFRVTPLDVAEYFHEKVLRDCDSLLLTSATLAEKGRYDRYVHTLGFDRLESEKLVFADPLPNAYDYWHNSVLAIPADSPGYGKDCFTDYAATAIIGVAKILSGRTMALFSSLERLQRVLTRVKLPLENEGISILGGEDSSRRSDLDHFRKDENAVLFGSRGFFEGVDVFGPALSCIIIDKLPFPYQGDPLLMARSRYLGRMGRSPFDELLLFTVKRTLRQQFGRLIRSETDKGFVLVLDQLGNGKSYCNNVIQELPGPQILQGVKLEEIMEIMKERFAEWGYEICVNY